MLDGFCFIEANINSAWVGWEDGELIVRFSSLVVLKKYHNPEKVFQLVFAT